MESVERSRLEIEAHVATICAANEDNETETVRAMQRLFSMCRSKTENHLANQAAAADAGGVPALLELVDRGSTRQRTWAFNTLGRLCFDHAENAAEVCRSHAIEAAVENIIGRSPRMAAAAAEDRGEAEGEAEGERDAALRDEEEEVDVSLALKSNDQARVKDKSAYLLGNLAARPASHRRLLESGAANAAVAVLRALNRAREEDIPESQIHAAFIARSVGLLTNLSVHEVSRGAVREAGALGALERVAREPGHDNHRPASAAIASANLCSDSISLPDSIPVLEPMPHTVLEYVVKALSSAVKREKYMGNVYYTPWKVAMGVRNLAAMHQLNLQRLADAGAIDPLVDGLSFDERSADHCSRALYELCVGDSKLEREIWPPPPGTGTAADALTHTQTHVRTQAQVVLPLTAAPGQGHQQLVPKRTLAAQLRVQRTLTPLVVAQQRAAWAHCLMRSVHPAAVEPPPTDGHLDALSAETRAPVSVSVSVSAAELLSADMVESVARWVASIWCSNPSSGSGSGSGGSRIGGSSPRGRPSWTVAGYSFDATDTDDHGREVDADADGSLEPGHHFEGIHPPPHAGRHFPMGVDGAEAEVGGGERGEHIGVEFEATGGAEDQQQEEEEEVTAATGTDTISDTITMMQEIGIAAGGGGGGMQSRRQQHWESHSPTRSGGRGAAVLTHSHSQRSAHREKLDRVLEVVLVERVSKNDEFCIENEKLCITNENLCIKNDEICSALHMITRTNARKRGSGVRRGCCVFLFEWPLFHHFFTKNRCILKDFG